MSVITTFCLILSISDAFHTHNHHKHGKYHRSHIRQPQRQTIFTSGNQLSQIYAQLYQEAPNIDIRGSFADVSYQSSRERGHESLSVDQCGLRSEDFFETATRRNFVCTWKNEVIVRKHNRRQFWCIGYLPREKDKREKAVLTLKFDRSYQIGYVSFAFMVSKCRFSSKKFFSNSHQEELSSRALQSSPWLKTFTSTRRNSTQSLSEELMRDYQTLKRSNSRAEESVTTLNI